jgi:hypothetical protein
MDTQSLTQRVVKACGELGLDPSLCASIATKALEGQPDVGAATAGDEVARLREENRRMQAERERWEKTEREVMQLLGTQNPQKIIHDLRNVLNELSLLQALTSDNV